MVLRHKPGEPQARGHIRNTETHHNPEHSIDHGLSPKSHSTRLQRTLSRLQIFPSLLATEFKGRVRETSEQRIDDILTFWRATNDDDEHYVQGNRVKRSVTKC
jgi:hypothetical protein